MTTGYFGTRETRDLRGEDIIDSRAVQAAQAPGSNFTEWSKDLMVFALLMEQRVYSEEWKGR